MGSSYTKVPNELLHTGHPLWSSPGAMQLYLAMLSIQPGKEFTDSQDLANYLGLPLHGFRKNFRRLQQHGMVSRWGCLSLDFVAIKQQSEEKDTNSSPPAKSKDSNNSDPTKLIYEQLSEEPNRKSTGLNEKTRWELIKEAWNTYKPDNYPQMDGALNKPLLIAIDTQSKRLRLDRDDYLSFIGPVLTGISIDDWWKKTPMKPSSVFGFGAVLKDTKFQNVEKLYKMGLQRFEKNLNKSRINWNDDQVVIKLINDLNKNDSIQTIKRYRCPTEDWDTIQTIRLSVWDQRPWPVEREKMDVLRRKIKLQELGIELDPSWIPDSVLLLIYGPEGSTPIASTDLINTLPFN